MNNTNLANRWKLFKIWLLENWEVKAEWQKELKIKKNKSFWKKNLFLTKLD